LLAYPQITPLSRAATPTVVIAIFRQLRQVATQLAAWIVFCLLRSED
jgi:hypothetical protein